VIDYDTLLAQADRIQSQIIDHGVEKVRMQGFKTHCRNHTYVPAKSMGYYGQVRFDPDPQFGRGSRNRDQPKLVVGKKVYCHVVAAMVRTREKPDGREASHLCHNPRCVRPSHMTFENGALNKSRSCCELFLGLRVDYICPHEPRCLRRRRD